MSDSTKRCDHARYQECYVKHNCEACLSIENSCLREELEETKSALETAYFHGEADGYEEGRAVQDRWWADWYEVDVEQAFKRGYDRGLEDAIKCIGSTLIMRDDWIECTKDPMQLIKLMQGLKTEKK